MALTATMYRLEIALQDVDRGVYESIELRAAQHPSESARRLLTRILAYCLCYEEGVAFGRGVSNADEPALWVKDLQGNIMRWIEVGVPSAERLHKAAKAVSRVAVFAYGDPSLVINEAKKRPLHRGEHIELYAVPPAFLDALEPLLQRHMRWELTVSGGTLFLTVDGQTLEGAIEQRPLLD